MPACLLTDTDQAIGKRLRPPTAGAGVSPELRPKRNSELIATAAAPPTKWRVSRVARRKEGRRTGMTHAVAATRGSVRTGRLCRFRAAEKARERVTCFHWKTSNHIRYQLPSDNAPPIHRGEHAEKLSKVTVTSRTQVRRGSLSRSSSAEQD
jgi:hypothetical protein